MSSSVSSSPDADNSMDPSVHHPLPHAPGVTYSAWPMHMYPYSPSNLSSLASTFRTKRRQVKNACTNCQRSCKKCDDNRPCLRCVKYGCPEDCVDSQRKERKKGLKRGPYKKRDGAANATLEQAVHQLQGSPLGHEEAPDNPSPSSSLSVSPPSYAASGNFNQYPPHGHPPPQPEPVAKPAPAACLSSPAPPPPHYYQPLYVFPQHPSAVQRDTLSTGYPVHPVNPQYYPPPTMPVYHFQPYAPQYAHSEVHDPPQMLQMQHMSYPYTYVKTDRAGGGEYLDCGAEK